MPAPGQFQHGTSCIRRSAALDAIPRCCPHVRRSGTDVIWCGSQVSGGLCHRISTSIAAAKRLGGFHGWGSCDCPMTGIDSNLGQTANNPLCQKAELRERSATYKTIACKNMHERACSILGSRRKINRFMSAKDNIDPGPKNGALQQGRAGTAAASSPPVEPATDQGLIVGIGASA